jgi:regulator of sigma E protease
MLTFFIVLIGLSLLILGHEAGHFFFAKKFGMKVDEFGIGFPPRAFAKKKGETEYSVNWLPFGGFVRIAGEDGAANGEAAETHRYFFAQAAWRRAIVVAAGVAINFLLGWLFIAAVFTIGTPAILAVQDVSPNSPAATAGLKTGDILRDFRTANDFITYVKNSAGGTAVFTVYREGKSIDFNIKPALQNGEARIGVALEEGGSARMNPLRALGLGFKASLNICWMTLVAFYQLVSKLFSQGKLLEGVVGPVGIFGLAATTSRFGFIYLLQLFGVISLNLAVANLIPFPALDGGRLLLLLIEKIKGSPVPKKVEGILNGVGFALLLLIMLLVTVRDVVHWIR